MKKKKIANRRIIFYLNDRPCGITSEMVYFELRTQQLKLSAQFKLNQFTRSCHNACLNNRKYVLPSCTLIETLKRFFLYMIKFDVNCKRKQFIFVVAGIYFSFGL